MNTAEKSEPLPKHFWSHFLSEKDSLHTLVLSGDAVAAYDRIGELLAAANYPHVYEITCDDEDAFLIFTPENDHHLAKTVDAFVAEAPRMPGWRVFNRRQRRPVEDALVMLEHLYDVDAKDMMLSISERRSGIDVTMHTAAAEILGEPEKEGFVSFFLEHALGEEIAMRLGSKSIDSAISASAALTPGVFVSTILDLDARARENHSSG